MSLQEQVYNTEVAEKNTKIAVIEEEISRVNLEVTVLIEKLGVVTQESESHRKDLRKGSKQRKVLKDKFNILTHEKHDLEIKKEVYSSAGWKLDAPNPSQTAQRTLFSFGTIYILRFNEILEQIPCSAAS